MVRRACAVRWRSLTRSVFCVSALPESPARVRATDGGIFPPSVLRTTASSGPVQHPWRRSEDRHRRAPEIAERHGSCGAQAGRTRRACRNEPEPRGDGSFLVRFLFCRQFIHPTTAVLGKLFARAVAGMRGAADWLFVASRAADPAHLSDSGLASGNNAGERGRSVGLARSRSSSHPPSVRRPMTQPTVAPSSLPDRSPTRFEARRPTTSGFEISKIATANSRECHVDCISGFFGWSAGDREFPLAFSRQLTLLPG